MSSSDAVLAPVRDTFAFLGFQQTWDPRTDTVRLRSAAGTLSFVIGTRHATYLPSDGTVARSCELAEATRYVGGVLCGPLEELWRVAGVEYAVISQSPASVEYAVVIRAAHEASHGTQIGRITVRLLSEEDQRVIANATGSVVKLTTNRGDIYLELFDEQTPVTAGNFLELVGRGFYDGTTFHRVIREFMIQGGDPQGDGTGGPGFTIPDEADKGLKHERGSLSMAKTPAPNSGGSQFFICHVPCPHLDGVHTVFGRCVQGMEVVDAIAQGDYIAQATILKRSAAAEAAIAAALAARVPDQR